MIRGSCWGSLGALVGPPLRVFLVVLGSSWGSFARLGEFKALLGPSWGFLAARSDTLGGFGAISRAIDHRTGGPQCAGG